MREKNTVAHQKFNRGPEQEQFLKTSVMLSLAMKADSVQ